MRNRARTGIVLLMLVQMLAGCDGSRSSIPSAPSSIPPSAPPPAPPPASINGLMMFTERASGFSTSDLRDAQEHIVQFNTANELIWTADGTHLPGFRAQGNVISLSANTAEASCKCTLVVRFGTRDGERRAYLTADYIHDNPGTLVDLEIAAGALAVSRTNVFPPGTYTLSGVVTEATATGLVPVENAEVWRLDEEQSGWDHNTTDKNGFYQLHGLSDGSREATFSKEGYQTIDQGDVPVHGDTRFDVQLVRR